MSQRVIRSAFALLALAANLGAQTFRGRIDGSVIDSRGPRFQLRGGRSERLRQL